MSTSFAHRPATGRPLPLRVDFALVLTTVTVAALGVVLVYSATRSKLAAADINPHYFLTRQAAYVVVGGVVMIVLAALDYRWLEHASAVLYVVMILALLAMFSGIGSSALGATRWVQIGGVQIQPSAFATLVLIVTVATFCARRPDGLDRTDLLKVLALAAVPILLVVKQPDLGSGIVMSVVLLVMLVVAGIPNRYLLLLVLVVATGAYAVVHLKLGCKRYQLNRITAVFHARQEPAEHRLQRGPVGGRHRLRRDRRARGCSTGRQTNLAYVPEQQTDFIFSAVGEQLGFVGAAGVLLACSACSSWRLLRSRPAGAGHLRTAAWPRACFTLVAFSVFENAGMAMGIMPVAGIPLPFLSYGGSATVGLLRRDRHRAVACNCAPER